MSARAIARCKEWASSPDGPVFARADRTRRDNAREGKQRHMSEFAYRHTRIIVKQPHTTALVTPGYPRDVRRWRRSRGTALAVGTHRIFTVTVSPGIIPAFRTIRALRVGRAPADGKLRPGGQQQEHGRVADTPGLWRQAGATVPETVAFRPAGSRESCAVKRRDAGHTSHPCHGRAIEPPAHSTDR